LNSFNSKIRIQNCIVENLQLGYTAFTGITSSFNVTGTIFKNITHQTKGTNLYLLQTIDDSDVAFEGSTFTDIEVSLLSIRNSNFEMAKTTMNNTFSNYTNIGVFDDNK
jgi:hypothetical protein